MRSSRDLAGSVPNMLDNRARIEMTASCKDCDAIPKVPNGGAVIVENGQAVQIMHNGLRVVAGGYYGAWMSELIQRLHGHHEPQEELVFDTLLRLLPERATMIEIGGFWSYYSLWFLQAAPQRCAFVIEPDPNYLEIGIKNARLNRATIEFVQGFAGPQSRANAVFQTESSGQIEIPMINIADFIVDHQIDRLTVLHCDAQGAEIDVINSCEDLFRHGRIQFAVVSTHAYQLTGDTLVHQRCLDSIVSAGGRILVEHDVRESFSGDGLIVAQFGPTPIQWPKLHMSYNRYSKALFRNPVYDLSLALTDATHLRGHTSL